jgi:hypothetical protein
MYGKEEVYTKTGRVAATVTAVSIWINRTRRTASHFGDSQLMIKLDLVINDYVKGCL